MKTLVRKRSFAAAAVGGLASVGLLAAPAMAATPAPPGHGDIVAVHCDDEGNYTFTSELNGVSSVPNTDLDLWEFNYPLASGAVSPITGGWGVDADSGTGVPDLGFTYHADDEGACAASINVETGNSNVKFDGSSTVPLNQGAHVHAIWTFTGAGTAFSATFTVKDAISNATLGSYDTTTFNVGY